MHDPTLSLAESIPPYAWPEMRDPVSIDKAGYAERMTRKVIRKVMT